MKEIMGGRREIVKEEERVREMGKEEGDTDNEGVRESERDSVGRGQGERTRQRARERERERECVCVCVCDSVHYSVESFNVLFFGFKCSKFP